MRTKSVSIVKNATDPYKDEIVGFEPDKWLDNPANVALTNEDGDVSLFERQLGLPGTVCGHYFFHSRGKKARETAVAMLKQAFTGPYNITTIIGLTPLDNLGALWMNKQLGFKSYGQVDTETGMCEFVVLTKHEWENDQNE
jgi:hypothetical protein